MDTHETSDVKTTRLASMLEASNMKARDRIRKLPHTL